MAPPAGTVTLLFTDIEGSTRLLDALGAEAYASVLADHHRVLRAAVAAHAGYEVDTEGDAFFVSFGSARSAVEAAAAAQRALAAETWPDGVRVRVRMGLHSGEPLVAGDRYVGVDVHRAARVMSAGHGGQVLLSQATRDLVHQDLDGISLLDLGEHRLKDLTLPQRLYQLVLPGVESEFPALATLENRPTNLPAQPTALVGRERELEDLAELIVRADVRLVTLTGPGGTGKTRLALQAAAELVEHYPDGVWFVNLAPLADPADVLATIAQTLAVREEGGRALADTLGAHLRSRRALLLLDNFEHVLRAARDLTPLMQGAPDVTVLATSRAPLQLRGEREFSVPPLALPDPGRVTFETLPHYPAVRLFLERAQAARRDFVLTAENAPAIAGICARLDGLPLAIELAAARVKLLPPAALLGRLDQRLKLLTGGARDLDERQQTLRAAIDWSYRLLDDEGRLLLDRMAVFAGGRTLGALEAVCNPDGELDVFAGVSALVDNNLLRRDEGPDGEPRFVMLETIHEYARERLDERGEAEALGSAHAGFFLELAERVGPQLTGEGQAAAYGLLEAEEANIATALRFLDDTGRTGEYVRLANSLGRWWTVQGRYGEGRRILERAAAVGQDPAERARSLRLTANIAYHHGDDDAVERLAAEAAELTRGDAARRCTRSDCWRSRRRGAGTSGDPPSSTPRSSSLRGSSETGGRRPPHCSTGAGGLSPAAIRRRA